MNASADSATPGSSSIGRPEILRERTVRPLFVPKAQIPSLLHEVHELVNFKQRYESPPSPQSRGGTAIHRIPRFLISSTSAGRPALISSIRLFPFRFRFVGKLMMYRGLVRRPVEDQHFSGTHLLASARRLVNLEVLRKCLSELEGNATAHHADTVDRVGRELLSRQEECHRA
jgi:hypothetical protein